MPFGAATAVKNRNQTKIVSIPFDCGDAANAVAYTFAAIAGMSDCYRTPRHASITRMTGPNSESEFQITAMSKTGFTIAKLTAGGAGAGTLLVRLQ
jgi:hypothetical protein